ncbi:MAG TPA: MoaD/ThiS family protein [Chloroflexota bacterium]|nr:MoaD/ThiS family protein [Chloroflexota bacterium]
MRVRVVPYAELRRLLPARHEELWLEVPEGATVGDALRILGLVTEERLIIGLDGRYATPDTPLHTDAELTLVTPMMGGTT